jgi:hypothetical protein
VVTPLIGHNVWVGNKKESLLVQKKSMKQGVVVVINPLKNNHQARTL